MNPGSGKPYTQGSGDWSMNLIFADSQSLLERTSLNCVGLDYEFLSVRPR